MTGGSVPRARGDRFERLVRATLEMHGWVVVRSAGSLGCADLVAFRSDHQPWFISCKATVRPYLLPKEWHQLWHTAISVNACPVIAHKARNGAAGIAYVALMVPSIKAVDKADESPFRRLDAI